MPTRSEPRAVGRVLLAYTLLICFGDAFKLHTWLPVPLIVLLGALLITTWVSFVRPIRLDRAFFRPFDLLLLCYVLWLGLSLLFSGRIERKNINHLVAYTTVVALYYCFVKFLFAADQTFERYEPRLRRALAMSVLLVSVYAVLEFLDRNWTHWGVTALVRFPADIATEQYQPLFLVFIRARGFMSEPAMLALFLNTFVPMSFVHLRGTWGTAPAVMFVVVAAVASAVTFSVGALAFIALGLAVAVGMYVFDRGIAFVPARRAVVMAGVLVLVVALAAQLPAVVWQQVADKLSLVNDPASGYDRLRHWSDALPVALRHPLGGTGIGSTSAEQGSGVISFYLTMLKEGGIPALLLIVAFFVLVFREIARLPRRHPYKYAYAASFVAAVAHYAIVSDIWYPWFWLLCIFVVAERRSALAGDAGRPAQHAPHVVADAAPGVS